MQKLNGDDGQRGKGKPTAAKSCTLYDLRPVDKQKLAKLLRQVVDLGQENQQLKEVAGKERQVYDEKMSNLSSCNQELVKENMGLKQKLAQMLVIMRTQQHRVALLDSALRHATRETTGVHDGSETILGGALHHAMQTGGEHHAPGALSGSEAGPGAHTALPTLHTQTHSQSHATMTQCQPYAPSPLSPACTETTLPPPEEIGQQQQQRQQQHTRPAQPANERHLQPAPQSATVGDLTQDWQMFTMPCGAQISITIQQQQQQQPSQPHPAAAQAAKHPSTQTHCFATPAQASALPSSVDIGMESTAPVAGVPHPAAAAGGDAGGSGAAAGGCSGAADGRGGGDAGGGAASSTSYMLPAATRAAATSATVSPTTHPGASPLTRTTEGAVSSSKDITSVETAAPSSQLPSASAPASSSLSFMSTATGPSEKLSPAPSSLSFIAPTVDPMQNIPAAAAAATAATAIGPASQASTAAPPLALAVLSREATPSGSASSVPAPGSLSTPSTITCSSSPQPTSSNSTQPTCSGSTANSPRCRRREPSLNGMVLEAAVGNTGNEPTRREREPCLSDMLSSTTSEPRVGTPAEGAAAWRSHSSRDGVTESRSEPSLSGMRPGPPRLMARFGASVLDCNSLSSRPRVNVGTNMSGVGIEPSLSGMSSSEEELLSATANLLVRHVRELSLSGIDSDAQPGSNSGGGAKVAARRDRELRDTGNSGGQRERELSLGGMLLEVVVGHTGHEPTRREREPSLSGMLSGSVSRPGVGTPVGGAARRSLDSHDGTSMSRRAQLDVIGGRSLPAWQHQRPLVRSSMASEDATMSEGGSSSLTDTLSNLDSELTMASSDLHWVEDDAWLDHTLSSQQLRPSAEGLSTKLGEQREMDRIAAALESLARTKNWTAAGSPLLGHLADVDQKDVSDQHSQSRGDKSPQRATAAAQVDVQRVKDAVRVLDTQHPWLPEGQRLAGSHDPVRSRVWSNPVRGSYHGLSDQMGSSRRLSVPMVATTHGSHGWSDPMAGGHGPARPLPAPHGFIDRFGDSLVDILAEVDEIEALMNERKGGGASAAAGGSLARSHVAHRPLLQGQAQEARSRVSWSLLNDDAVFEENDLVWAIMEQEEAGRL